MAEPLIPFVEVPEIPLSFLQHLPLVGQLVDPNKPPSIKPFGVLVALGVYIGSVVAVQHARQRRLDERRMHSFIFWMLVGGFVGAHVLDAVWYHPDKVARDPLYLIALWDGLSSFGGFVGATLGAIAYRVKKRERILPYCEVVNSAFPLAWVFGRAGCASVHDHPGRLSDAWFAVRWPYGAGWQGRLDLGLVECVLTIPLAVAFAILWHRKPDRPLGFYTGIMCAAYAPVRFLLDFLRESEGKLNGGDPRYAGLTPAQWGTFGLLALGLYFLRMAARGEGAAPVPADAEVQDERVADDDDAAAEGEPAAPRRRRG